MKSSSLVMIWLVVIGLTHVVVLSGGVDIAHTAQQVINGQQVEVSVAGTLADIIVLDGHSSVKKLKCEKNKIILIGKDDSLGRNWTQGQIIFGGASWGCYLNSLLPYQAGIFGIVTHVSFSTYHRVNVYIEETRALNVFTNTTTITVRSKGSCLTTTTTTTTTNNHSQSMCVINEFSRDPQYLVKLRDRDNITLLPNDQQQQHRNDNSSSSNSSSYLSKLDVDLNMKVSNCVAKSNIDFEIQMIIAKDDEGDSHVESLYNQMNISVESGMEIEAEVFHPMAARNSLTGAQQGAETFLNIPVSPPLRSLPPLVLQMLVQPESSLGLSIFASPAGTTRINTALTSRADYSTVFEYSHSGGGGDGGKQKLTVSEWKINNRTRLHTDVQQDLSMTAHITHQLKFTSHLGLMVDRLHPLHTFHTYLGTKPAVAVQSKAAGPVRTTKVTTQFTASVTASPATTNITDGKDSGPWTEQVAKDQTLLQQNTAECHNNNVAESDQSLDMVHLCAAIYLGKSNSNSRIRLYGNDLVFMSEVSQGAWCLQQGRQCAGCHHPTPSQSCVDRMVTPDLALSLSRLAIQVNLTWPDRKLVVLKGWKGSSSQPSSSKDALFYNEGRAIQVGLSKPLGKINVGLMTLENSTQVLDMLEKLAMCADIPYVRQMKNASALELATCGPELASAGPGTSPEKAVFDLKMFWESMNITSSDVTMCYELLNQPFPVGSTFPANTTVEQVCGTAEGAIHRTNTRDYTSLFVYPYNDVEFDKEGPTGAWCGNSLRSCLQDCNNSSSSNAYVPDEPWTWCSRRVMTPRMASRLRELARLVEASLPGKKKPATNKPAIKVVMAHKEPTQQSSTVTLHYHPLYMEGRGLRLTLTNSGLNSQQLAVLAICAGFDYVSFTDASFIELFVKKQAGFTASQVDFPSRSLLVVNPPFSQSKEYAYPRSLQMTAESSSTMLFDGSNPMMELSPHFKIKDFVFSGTRYFRLDPQLLVCLDNVKQTFPEKFHIVPDGAYHSMTANLLNQNGRHPEEIQRFHAGKAVEITTEDKQSCSILLLAETVIRQCSTRLRAVEQSLGIGLHAVSLYLDVRPRIGSGFIKIWNAGAEAETVCKDSAPQREMCTSTVQQRGEAAMQFMKGMQSAAGVGALRTSDLFEDLRQCLVNNCGGCVGSGTQWLHKSQGCISLLHTFLNGASQPLPSLHNTVAFYSAATTATASSIHHLACGGEAAVCLENIPIYNTISALLASKYSISGSTTVKELLFDGEYNPSPLTEILEQELAMRASGNVSVFIEADSDVGVLRNVIKILLVYNPKVQYVHFYADTTSGTMSVQKLSTSLRRKVEVWSHNTCPWHSRVSVTPFSVESIPGPKLRRSAELSKPRNDRVTSRHNWELDWLDSL
ncbi:uncharacterized protein LOC115224777 [Argonauta hians]